MQSIPFGHQMTFIPSRCAKSIATSAWLALLCLATWGCNPPTSIPSDNRPQGGPKDSKVTLLLNWYPAKPNTADTTLPSFTVITQRKVSRSRFVRVAKALSWLPKSNWAASSSGSEMRMMCSWLVRKRPSSLRSWLPYKTVHVASWSEPIQYSFPPRSEECQATDRSRKAIHPFLKSRGLLDSSVQTVPYMGTVTELVAGPGVAQQAYNFSEPLLAEQAASRANPDALRSWIQPLRLLPHHFKTLDS